MRLRYLTIMAGLALCPGVSLAAINCTVTSVQPVNFGTVNPLASGTASASTTLSYSCTKTLGELLSAVTLCFNIGPSSVTSQVTTRSMSFAGPPTSTLSYQLYQAPNGVVWGSQYQAGTSPVIVNLGSLSSLFPSTGSVTVYGSLVTPQTSAAPGTYQDIYAGLTASMTTNTAALIPPGTCGSTVAANYPFNVTATVVKQCTVTASGNINLGSVNSTALNTTSSNSLSVTCSNRTPYTVGLVPSNGSTTGAGVMSSTAPNNDKVGYQLSSTPGPNGTPWGNTALNYVAGTGIGTATSYNVYATVPSANYTPGSYADTVTVNVTY
ncbi:spore coat protein U domain-containing protein [Rouxiella chamberiensis]|uniref:Spore coat protein U domain-containing protein n=1 Tax=Rouxiella chamberiensis TaxID=1513468 RepID=A0ABY7HS45_9GAMM|nr:spore coat protein U domain-containing protein [Rouxiella chamberiensis]WAT01884.1 spore coat protein U domain-containing protein [Rouxiella chamberiensis]